MVYKTKIKPADRPQIASSEDCYKILRSTWNDDTIELREQFKILLLNRSLRVIGIVDIATGGINEIAIDLRLIFAAALKANAIRLVLAHNHPGGSLQPSTGDKEGTRIIVEAGKLLHIRIEDHLIICVDSYYSFADEGLL